MQDMDYFKIYQFISDGNNIPCYGLEDLIFTFSTDENDNIEDYTLSGSCSLDMGTQINNKIVDDLSENTGMAVFPKINLVHLKLNGSYLLHAVIIP